MPCMSGSLAAGAALVVLSATLCRAANGADAIPRTASQVLQNTRGKSEAQRKRALARFAQDPRPALEQRLRAVDGALRLAKKGTRDRIEYLQLKAQLLAVGARWSARARVLRQLAADEKRAGRVRQAELHAQLAREESVLGRVSRLVSRIVSGSNIKLATRDQTSVDGARNLAALYDELGDRVQGAQALCWVAIVQDATNAADDVVEPQLGSCAEATRELRDLAQLQREALRRLSQRAVQRDDWHAALDHAMRADRVVVVPATKAAFDAVESSPYRRSETTARLCHLARARGLSCVELERALDGQLTMHDYSQRPVMGELEAEVAAEVLSNYDALLQDCVQQGARSGELLKTRVELEWSVGLDGRCRLNDLRPQRLRDTAFAACVNQALGQFRYPRYRGEMQHVSLSYEVGE
ncbi:MAG: hypothetical protein ABIJ09_13475 [Pseudomonadota bacterium]